MVQLQRCLQFNPDSHTRKFREKNQLNQKHMLRKHSYPSYTYGHTCTHACTLHTQNTRLIWHQWRKLSTSRLALWKDIKRQSSAKAWQGWSLMKHCGCHNYGSRWSQCVQCKWQSSKADDGDHLVFWWVHQIFPTCRIPDFNTCFEERLCNEDLSNGEM